YKPDVVVVLDSSLIGPVDITGGIKEGGKVIINTGKNPEELELGDNFSVHTVDATSVAMEKIGKPIVNTAMLGSLSKITGVVKMESLVEEVMEHFGEKLGKTNADVMMGCCEKTLTGD
ncbi:MAG: 2-oxoacid:acceptor oxidoreductase family protein, partial [Candidatus Micrarchaeia archaeon]